MHSSQQLLLDVVLKKSYENVFNMHVEEKDYLNFIFHFFLGHITSFLSLSNRNFCTLLDVFALHISFSFHFLKLILK